LRVWQLEIDGVNGAATIDNPELIVYRIRPTRVRYMQEWALEYYEVPLGDARPV